MAVVFQDIFTAVSSSSLIRPPYSVICQENVARIREVVFGEKGRKIPPYLCTTIAAVLKASKLYLSRNCEHFREWPLETAILK